MCVRAHVRASTHAPYPKTATAPSSKTRSHTERERKNTQHDNNNISFRQLLLAPSSSSSTSAGTVNSHLAFEAVAHFVLSLSPFFNALMFDGGVGGFWLVDMKTSVLHFTAVPVSFLISAFRAHFHCVRTQYNFFFFSLFFAILMRGTVSSSVRSFISRGS